jgi:hypothetical protein
MASSPSRPSTNNFNTTQLDDVELIEKNSSDNAISTEPIVANPEEESTPASILRNPIIQITLIKLFLVSTTFLVVGIGLGVLIGLESCPADNSSVLGSQVPAPQPTLYPTELPIITPPTTGNCSTEFEFPVLSSVFFANSTRTVADCSYVDVVPFVDFLLTGLRLESIAGNIFTLLGLCVLVQLGGIPHALNGAGEKFSFPGVVMWFIWIFFSVFQYIATFVAQLMGVLAAFNFVGQYQDELQTIQGGLGIGTGAGLGAGLGAVIGIIGVTSTALLSKLKYQEEQAFWNVVPCLSEHKYKNLILVVILTTLGSIIGAFYGSFTDATLFAAIVPSLLFHPTFVAKNAALCLYAFIFLQGIAAAGFVIDTDKAMLLYASVTCAPLLAIGVVYFFFTASFVFSVFFFVPMVLCLTGIFIVYWRALKVVKEAIEGPGIVDIQGAEVDCGTFIKPLEGTLWWLPNSSSSILSDTRTIRSGLYSKFRPLRYIKTDISAFSVMLTVVMFSSALLVLSPLLVFGHWAAFYSYLGNSPSDNMTYVARIYRHFFGVLIDFKFYVPDLFNFNLGDIPEWISVLMDVPSFDALPPAAMLEGMAVYSALSLFLAFMKPIVCVFSFIFSIFDMVAKNDKVGSVAETLGSNEGILNALAGGDNVTMALHQNIKNLRTLRVPKDAALDISNLVKCEYLMHLNADFSRGVTGKNNPAIFILSWATIR